MCNLKSESDPFNQSQKAHKIMAPKRKRDVAAADDGPPAEGSPVTSTSPAKKRTRKNSGRKVSEIVPDGKPAAATRRSTRDRPTDMNVDLAPAVVQSSDVHEDLTFTLRAAESFVKNELASNDSSHDFFHISRVRAVAETLAAKEGLSASSRQVVSLSALTSIRKKSWKTALRDRSNDAWTSLALGSPG